MISKFLHFKHLFSFFCFDLYLFYDFLSEVYNTLFDDKQIVFYFVVYVLFKVLCVRVLYY